MEWLSEWRFFSSWLRCEGFEQSNVNKGFRKDLHLHFPRSTFEKNRCMHFSLDKTEKYVVIKLHEQKLNTLIAAELKSELLLLNTQGFNNIILDLEESLYCDSSGLSAILVGNRLCRNSSGLFVITGLSDTVMKLVQISQLDQVLNLALTANDAIDFINETEEERKIEDKIERDIKE